jgi:lysyl-tRNA synthetase class 1
MAFLPDPDQVAEEVQRLAKDAPLMSMLTQQIVGEDRVAARIGSVEDDLPGRVLQHTVRVFQINVRLVHAVIHAAIERHKLMPSDFVSWANRRGVVEPAKLPLLFAGVQAWFCRDYFKTVHILIPQVEAALRRMVDLVGKPTTKPAGTVPGVSVSINMSDVLFNPATVAALGPMGERLALYMKAIYADPRGMNLRNEFAHGLLDAAEVNEAAAIWIIHSLCVIGLWQRPDV